MTQETIRLAFSTSSHAATQPRDERPSLWLVAGPNGAGKSTLIRNLTPYLKLPVAAPSLNADAIQVVLTNLFDNQPNLLPQASVGTDSSWLNLLAVTAVEATARASIRNQQDVLLETVLSSDKYLSLVHEAKAQAMHVGMIYIALPTPEEHIERVRIRHSQGGHDVPTDKIIHRWHRSHDMLGQFMTHLDTLYVYTNPMNQDAILLATKTNGVLTLHGDTALCPKITETLRDTTRSRAICIGDGQT